MNRLLFGQRNENLKTSTCSPDCENDKRYRAFLAHLLPGSRPQSPSHPPPPTPIGDNGESCFHIFMTFLKPSTVPLRPVAFFPLNGQYETADISLRSNPPGLSNDVRLAPGPDGSTGGSYQFSGNSTSFIKFPNNGGLDTKYSMTFLAWVYHEQTDGPIFYYAEPGSRGYGTRFLIGNGRFKNANLYMANLTNMNSIFSRTLQPETWHFVGYTYNYVSGQVKVWLNGSEHKMKFITWPAESATRQSVVMGAIPAGNVGNFKGRISCVQLYDRVLSKLEIEGAKQLCFTTGKKVTLK